ncbi:hypothetical protein SCOCK_220123 [Actinacidiphila cocklensis]|uniref:Uncharacterized protein n=1 Tax=Actinacidiphila cocklensis TaxID=887465 RepID=A0A9W4DPW6_9ACTN|nr:hypothetical protein SCOCK_220123 [Actinacidiphila cocklensis]
MGGRDFARTWAIVRMFSVNGDRFQYE